MVNVYFHLPVIKICSSSLIWKEFGDANPTEVILSGQPAFEQGIVMVGSQR